MMHAKTSTLATNRCQTQRQGWLADAEKYASISVDNAATLGKVVLTGCSATIHCGKIAKLGYIVEFPLESNGSFSLIRNKRLRNVPISTERVCGKVLDCIYFTTAEILVLEISAISRFKPIFVGFQPRLFFNASFPFPTAILLPSPAPSLPTVLSTMEINVEIVAPVIIIFVLVSSSCFFI